MTDKTRIKKFILNNRNQFAKWGDAAAEKNLHNSMEANDLLVRFCDAVVSFINSLQEEPIGKVWHYQKEEPIDEIADKSRPIVVIYGYNSLNAASKFRCYEDNSEAIWLSDSYKKWAFVEDLINLSQSVKTGDQEKPVSEDLEKAEKEWLTPQLDKSYANYGETKMMELTRFDGYAMLDAIEFGAKWQKENLWKPADGDDLPEIDREVIALTQPYPNDEHLRVVFAHRPSKYTKVWNSDLGEEQVVEVEHYGKGGWNIPDVKYWLDVELPKEIEL